MGSTPAWRDDKHFRDHVGAWSEKLSVRPREVHVRKMTSKWASCSAKGRLTFNSELLNERVEFGEYVIAHELLHLRIPNHGKLFKAMLRAHIPDWESRAQGKDVCGQLGRRDDD